MSDEANVDITVTDCERGVDQVEHRCLHSLTLLHQIDSFITPGLRDSLGIYRCRVCNQLWKIRFKWNVGIGSDDIWLKPGESKGGYSFALEEVRQCG